MPLNVRGHRLLIKPDPVKDSLNTHVPDGLKNAGFEIKVDARDEKMHEAGTEVGTLVGIGPTAWRAYDGNDSTWEPWAKLGDRVTFARYSGKLVKDPITEEKFFVINDVDMQCVITGEVNPFGD